jgi:hypothetical protein
MEIIALSPASGFSGYVSDEAWEEADAIGAILNVPVVERKELESYGLHFGQIIEKSKAEETLELRETTVKTIWGLT